MSESLTRPENFAEIGPNLTAAIAVISFSDVASRLSHPGMHAFRISGSLSALHTVFWGAEIRRSPAISMSSFPCLANSRQHYRIRRRGARRRGLSLGGGYAHGAQDMSQALEKRGMSEGAVGVVLDDDAKRRFGLTGQPDGAIAL